MKVTEAMLDAALRKATEAGLLPRHCSSYEMQVNREVMFGILSAAMREATIDFIEDTRVGTCATPLLYLVQSQYK
jgi:hypothetical protein